MIVRELQRMDAQDCIQWRLCWLGRPAGSLEEEKNGFSLWSKIMMLTIRMRLYLPPSGALFLPTTWSSPPLDVLLRMSHNGALICSIHPEK